MPVGIDEYRRIVVVFVSGVGEFVHDTDRVPAPMEDLPQFVLSGFIPPLGGAFQLVRLRGHGVKVRASACIPTLPLDAPATTAGNVANAATTESVCPILPNEHGGGPAPEDPDTRRRWK